jgi:oxygen-independent coproporphyrinogen-3 oxidase
MSVAPTLEECIAYADRKLREVDLEHFSRIGAYLRPEEYYLVGTYPPLKAMAPIDATEVFADASGHYDVYVHIPFCEQYCTFCHFAKEINPEQPRVERYLESMFAEFEIVSSKLNGPLSCNTLYFGGGTPSFLRPSQLETLFANIKRNLVGLEQAEVTFELHPQVIAAEDVVDRLAILEDHGVNRWVFGVQSMDDRVLAKLNRGHRAAEVYELVDLLSVRGVSNLSLDLMYGLPFQTLENWYYTLSQLVDLGLSKFNIFPLMFKSSDPISILYDRQPHQFPSEEDRNRMFLVMEHFLFAHGYRRGPIYYYSRGETHSRQQESKFESIDRTNLLPFGVSGFGYVGHTQYYNTCSMDDYMHRAQKREAPVWLGHSLSENEQARRFMMFNLKSKGVDRQLFHRTFGADA